MKKQEEFSISKRVSVWIGDFKSSMELDDYINMSRKFEEDFGFELNSRDMPEVSVESEPVPIERLVDGFSWCKAYAPAVVELANKLGVHKASTMVVFLNFDYEPGRVMAKDTAPLRYLGSVPFELT